MIIQPKITADGDCSHEIKRCLLPGSKVMTNLDNILKIRDIISPTQVCLVKAMVFPLVMHGCESWTVKKAECLRIDAFKLWCWRRLLSFSTCLLYLPASKCFPVNLLFPSCGQSIRASGSASVLPVNIQG